METVNQIILTLKEADALACAQNPHHQRLAIVLLDNIVELQLRRKSEEAFASDRTTWNSGVRKLSLKRRKSVSRYHAELLMLAVDKSWITEDDSRLLAYAHRIRNRIYHEGSPEDSTDLVLGLTLLYRFIRHHFPIWRSGEMIEISSEPPVAIDDAKNDASGRSPLLFAIEDVDHGDAFALSRRFQSGEHWSRILHQCLSFSDSFDVRPLIKPRIYNLIDVVQDSFDYLTKYDDTDFNAVLAQRFTIMTRFFWRKKMDGKTMKDPIAALNIYLAVLNSEERLLDIANKSERAAEFHKLVHEHEYQDDVIASLQLDRYRQVADSVTTQSESAGISHFLQVEQRLEAIGRAASECASDLEGYNQHMIDLMRGK
jgi:hypothetical protein